MIYLPRPADGYEGALCVDEDGDEYLVQTDGKACADTWRPVRVRRFSEGRDNQPADFPWLGGNALAMRRSAVEALADIFEEGCEILPLATDDDVELFVLNVTRVIDALDMERSTIRRLPDGGMIYLIEAAAFHEHMVRDVDFFKLPTERVNNVFVGERFIERVRAAGLGGLKFEFSWSPERGAVKRRLS